MKIIGKVMRDDPTQAGDRVSEETFLAREMAASVRHEYIDGYMRAMAGENLNHNTIALNIAAILKAHLNKKPCRPYVNGIKVRAAGDIYYPDVLVDCSEVAKGEYFAHHPLLIVEILSASTRKKDVTTKLMHYINIPSLQEYVLVEQDVVRVQVLRKEKQWQYEEFTAGDTVALTSVGLTLSVVEIYDGVDNADITAYRSTAG